MTFWLRFGTMGKEKTIYTRKKTTQDLKITFTWDKEMTAIAVKGQTHSHFIRVAALSSAGSVFPMRSSWVREWLNPVPEVAGFINLILWIIMPPFFTNEPALSKWHRSIFFSVIWFNIISVSATMLPLDKAVYFQKKPLPQAYTELEYSSLTQVHRQNYSFFIERLFKNGLSGLLYENT